MGEYLDFINKYSTQFEFELQYGEYLNVKKQVENSVNELLSFRGIKMNDIPTLIDSTMCFLLANHSVREILTYAYEDEIEIIIQKLYEKENSLKPKEEQKPFPEKNEAVDYIYKDLKDYIFIFKEGFNIGKLSKDIKDSLVFEGYKENAIIDGDADQTIIEYLAKGYFDVRFNEDFKNLRSSVTNLVVEVFNYRKKDATYYTNRDSFESKYFDNRTILGNVIFNITIAFLINKVNPRKLTSDSPEMEVIYNYIQKDMIRVNSTRQKPKNPQAEEVAKYKKICREEHEEKTTKSRKIAVVYSIIYGLASVENMIYNSLHQDVENKKHTSRNSYNVEPNAYDIERMSINVQNLMFNNEEKIELPETDIKNDIANSEIDEELEVPEKEDNDELKVPEIPDNLIEESEGENVINSEVYTLEDNNEYEVYDTIEEDSNTYLLLAQVNNVRNIVVRNLVYNQVNGEEHLERLDNDKFDEIFDKFMKKNKDLLK